MTVTRAVMNAIMLDLSLTLTTTIAIPTVTNVENGDLQATPIATIVILHAMSAEQLDP